MWVGNILYTIKVYMRDSIVYQQMVTIGSVGAAAVPVGCGDDAGVSDVAVAVVESAVAVTRALTARR